MVVGNNLNQFEIYLRLAGPAWSSLTQDLHRKTRGKNGENAFLLRSLRGQAQVRPIDKLDEACTNADDRKMLAQHSGGDCVMS